MNKNMSLALSETEIRTNELLISNERVVIAVDGMSGSGKTTFAEKLAERMSATIFHTDDFFLRPDQRTEERLSTPGGNIDIERLLEEVIVPLQNNSDFIYKPFNCHTMDFDEEKVISLKNIIILEGSYSCHPSLYDFCNLHIFLYTDKITQITRILRRGGYDKAKIFLSRWIPLENKYFSYFDIKEKCELKFYI